VIGLSEVQTDIPAEAAIIPSAPLTAPVESAVSVQAPQEAGLVDASAIGYIDDANAYADASDDANGHAEADADASANGRADASANGHRTVDRMVAWHGSPEPWPVHEQLAAVNGHGYPNGNGKAGPRTTRRERVPIQAVFAELAGLAAIPQSAYALDDEVPGAMCLLKTDDGFEVFASSDDARHEVRFFEDEEAAYFYLFGVLVAESVRNGQLLPAVPTYATRTENISKYLRERNSHNYPPNPVRVLNSRRG
jgi:hypothetical protein